MERMDRDTLRSLLAKMEQEAETVLAANAAFFEALQALKWEIDSDPRVQSVIRKLRATGVSMFISFVPRIRIRARAGKLVLALSRQTAESNHYTGSQDEELTHVLRDVAIAVIARSRYCRELNAIVNEAVQASESFERDASEAEAAGYELLICLDLSTYTQIRHRTAPRFQVEEGERVSGDAAFQLQLSRSDIQLLKELRIKID